MVLRHLLQGLSVQNHLGCRSAPDRLSFLALCRAYEIVGRGPAKEAHAVLGVPALEQTKHDDTHGGQDHKDDDQRHCQHDAAVRVVTGDVAIGRF